MCSYFLISYLVYSPAKKWITDLRSALSMACVSTALIYCVVPLLITGSIARSACRRYCSLLRGRFWGFPPAWATCCADGVTFGQEEGTDGPLLHAKRHPHRYNDKGVGLQKLTFLLRFHKNVEYKRPAGAYPLCDFHKICRVSTAFQDT